MYDKVITFLKLQSVQELLEEDNLEQVYTLWRRQGGDAHLLTIFFIMKNIDPLQYMTYICEGMYKGLAIRTLDLSKYNINMIGANAFEDTTELSEINIGNVTYIGRSAFNGCVSLTNITLPPKLRSIDSEAFKYSRLSSIHIPKNVMKIDNDAFSYCNNLENVTTDHTIEVFERVCCDLPMEDIFFNCANLDYVECSDGRLRV